MTSNKEKVSGAGRRDKEHEVNATRELWVPEVTNHGGFGRGRFIEVTDRGRDVTCRLPDSSLWGVGAVDAAP
jgi:hypothetical protein